MRLTFDEAAERTCGGIRMKRARAEILSTRKIGAYEWITLSRPEIAERSARVSPRDR